MADAIHGALPTLEKRSLQRRVDGKTLRVVFAEPMAFDKMLAGAWHKDGTRNHDESSAANALTVLPSTTDGYHDLQLREKAGGKWRRTFKWSAAEQRYR
ncbi:hypothetical protein WS55_01795 [Burkholderia pseudomultivorans]|nr:hypothetical protein WS55_01795 [Burkholderia pseudomultivorans]KVC31228.1 hypothetical protein WS56_17210 [Burkholderia pseudomultivorans]